MDPIIPYLIFDGNCREAMTFYKEALNGEIKFFRTVEDSPLDVADEHKNRIFDSHLQADKLIIKASDNLPQHKTKVGQNFSFFINFENLDILKRVYGKLSENGQIMMPLSESTTGPKFAMIRDKFEIQWMLTTE